MTQQPFGALARLTGEWALVGGLIGALVVPLAFAAESQAASELDEWAVADGLSLSVDATGFSLPTAISVVEDPGEEPNDPVYFVAELRGSIKAVTNDRSVVEVAAVPTVVPDVDDMEGASQSGLAGLCLAEDAGHVFATFAYPDDGGVLRNDVIRVDTGDRITTHSMGETRFSDVLANFQSSAAHQIGGCVVDEDRLLVAIGDGGNATVARDPEVLLGKVVCFDFEGGPCPEGPWSGSSGPAEYVYATGLRNPFGLVMVDGDLYAAENGISIDRFLRIDEGADHLWDGSDESIATGADVVLDPAVSPVQLGYVPSRHPLMADRAQDAFAFSVFNSEPATGIMVVDFDLGRQRPASVPYYLLQYVGEGAQHVVPAAVTADGILTAGSFPGPDGTSAILRLHRDDSAPHPVNIGLDWGEIDDARLGLLSQHGCISCHSWLGQGGGIGPALDPFALDWRLRERLNTPEYEARIEQLNAETSPEEQDRVAAREAVLAEEGHARTREWLLHFLQDPQFDNPEVRMPDPGLTPDEATAIRDSLVPAHRAGDQNLFDRTMQFVMGNRRAVAYGFVGGAGATVLGFGIIALVLRLRQRRNRLGGVD